MWGMGLPICTYHATYTFHIPKYTPRALVFTQTQQMLDIIEKTIRHHEFTYHRMDGGTGVGIRARLVDDFNTNPDVFAFLLTTKVGGLGVNLTGANRVLLYDPDWNPSTGMKREGGCVGGEGMCVCGGVCVWW